MDQEESTECPFTDSQYSQQSAKTSTIQEAVLKGKSILIDEGETAKSSYTEGYQSRYRYATTTQEAVSQGSVPLPYAFKPPESSIIYHSSSRRKNRTLIQAAREGSREQVDRLLEDGADISKKDGRGWTALQEAANGGKEEIVECLLKNGANVNAKDNRGSTALHRAASWGHSSVATMLITHGCNINEKDNLGQTALHKALRWRHSSTATCLLGHGANSKERDNAGRLPQEMRFRKRAKWKTRPLLENVALKSEAKPYQQQSLQRDKITVQFGGGRNLTVLCSALPASPVISEKVEKSVVPVPRSLSNLKFSSTASTCSSVCSSNSSGYASLEEDPEEEFVPIKGQPQPLETIAESTAFTDKKRTKYYGRPLHKAAIAGDLNKVISCIADGVDVNDKDMWNKTPLHYAVQYDHVDVLGFLIIVGANIEALDDQQQSPLYYAASARVVQCLLEHGANLQAVDECGLTAVDLVDESLPLLKQKSLVQHPLLSKIETEKLARKETEKRDKKVGNKEDENDQRKQIRSYSQLDKNKQQQDAHATKEKITQTKRSMLYVRLCKTSKPELENKLKGVPIQLKHKIEPERERKMPEFRKPQLRKSQSSKPQEIKVTPRKGHKENCQSEDVLRSTALQRATCSGDIELVKTLLYGEFDIDSTDEDECTSLHRAAIRGSKEIVQLLLNHGSDITAKDSDGWTPLHGASAGGHLDSVRCLTQRGADTEAKDYIGCTPLHRAAIRGQTSVSRFLLQQGCTTDVSDKDGWTPLHGAARYGHADMVKLLIQHGANARAVDNLGQTPLDLARAAGHLNCCTTLEKQKTTCTFEKKTSENKENPLHLNSCLKMEHDENNDSMELTKRCDGKHLGNQLKENEKHEAEEHNHNYARQIGQARESVLDKSGGILSIGDIKLVVPPGSIPNETKIRVTLEDPADFYSTFDDAGLMSGVVIAQPVVRLEPSGASFSIPVTFSTILPHGIGEGEELLVLHGSYNDDNPGKRTWEDITDTTCFDAESGTLTAKFAHFSRVMILLYKLVVIQPKVIVSWLNLKCTWYHMMLFCKKDTPNAPYTDVRIVFLSEDIYQMPGLREHEDVLIEILTKQSYKRIFDYNDNETYIKNGEVLTITLDLDPGFEISPGEPSNTKELVVDAYKWWTNGEQLGFVVNGDNVSETISGRIHVQKSNSCDPLKIPFSADDWHGYLQNYLRLGEVSNLLPIADKLGLQEEQKTWLIQSTWQCDKTQLKEILRCHKKVHPRERSSELKRQLSDVESNGVRLSNRGQMHVHNLRSLKVEPEDLGRDPDKDKMRYGFRKARKLVLSVLRDCCIEVSEDVREMECCLASEQFTSYLKNKTQVTDDLRQKIENLFDGTAQYEMIVTVVPQMVQFVKEIFKHAEVGKPSLNGMHGLQADDLEDSFRAVQELLVQKKSERLMSEISKILEKLCLNNEQRLCSQEGAARAAFTKWGRCLNFEQLLKVLDPFLKEPKGIKIRKRIEVAAELIRGIVDEKEQGDFIARDLSNIAEALMCFAKFVPARLVQFEVRCHQEEMVEVHADGDVKGGTNGAVFVQTFKLNRKGPFRILVTATGRVNMDGKESEFCLKLGESALKHRCYKKSQMFKSCGSAKDLQIVKVPEREVEEVELKLMYKRDQKAFTCESNGFVDLEDQEELYKSGIAVLPAIEEEQRSLALTASLNELDIADSRHVVEELSLETFQFLSNNLTPKGQQKEEVQDRNLNDDRKFQTFLQWLNIEQSEKVVSGMLDALELTSRLSYLNEIPKNTKKKIRNLSQMIKTPLVNKPALFKEMRKRLPAGCTGPWLDKNVQVSAIPYNVRDDLCYDLWAYDAWKPLAARVGVTNQRIKCMEKKDNPAEQALTEWEKKGLTVNDLYDALVECGCEALADKL